MHQYSFHKNDDKCDDDDDDDDILPKCNSIGKI
jgi:hypothetical protein